MIDHDAPQEVVTQDGVTLHLGDRAYNYYDMMPGTIERIDAYPQPDTMKGQNSGTSIDEWTNYWFTFRHTDGSSTSLDGSRICSIAFATKKGWI